MRTSSDSKSSPFTFIFRNRNLIATLVKRELTGKFAGTFLGLLWTILQPLLFAALYTIVFSVIMKAPTMGKYNAVPFPVWLLAGMLPWMLFSESIGTATKSITSNVNMIKKTLFDKRVLPLSGVCSGLINHCISLAILMTLMLFFGLTPHRTIIYLPVIIILTMLFTMAWAYILSALNVFFRDIDHALNPILQFAFFATPIVYPAELVPESLRFLVFINPMHHLISLYRQTLLLGVAPGTMTLLMATLGTWGFFIFADSLFRKLASDFCDAL